MLVVLIGQFKQERSGVNLCDWVFRTRLAFALSPQFQLLSPLYIRNFSFNKYKKGRGRATKVINQFFLTNSSVKARLKEPVKKSSSLSVPSLKAPVIWATAVA